MKAGLIKLTTPHYGSVWVQCSKILYIHRFVSSDPQVSSRLCFEGGEKLEVHESEMWVKDHLQTDEERKAN